MASFEAKIWSKRNSKKIKKIKKYHYGFISATIGWKWLRKRENKNHRYVSFQPDG